ncbi:MAG: YbbR-like domain-containing protein [Muribaculaceae bacterium]|nr:YbbR-like domain-containing protein [Muribaculaceae bacterium]
MARSQRGHNIIVFTVFLAISAILWCVIAFNGEAQSDVRMPVRITHVPDSVTIVSQVPRTISVSLQARGTQLLRLAWGGAPDFTIDFRMYHSDRKRLSLSEPDLKGIARNALDGANIVLISPDSLRLVYTTQPPVLLPVNADYMVTPGPQASITGKIRLSDDSVKVFTAGRLSSSVEAITTEPIRLTGLNETVTRRVALVAPPNSKVVPDSIDVTVEVEPLIFKTRKVTVEAVNVPHGMRLITFPAQVTVRYMIPVSDYKDSDPMLRVVADYNTIGDTHHSRSVGLRIVEASANLQNVHLAADSAEYILEQL